MGCVTERKNIKKENPMAMARHIKLFLCSMAELWGLRPNWNVGMLECWNTGMMGFEELTEWVIGKIKLTNHKGNEKFGSNPFGKRRVHIIPLFHV